MVSKSTVAYVAAFALLLFWAYFVQADTRRVDGYSMLPTLEGGDLVVIQGASISDVHVGDIIVYNGLCSSGGESVVHRVVQITSGGLITKGDNNPNTDQSPLSNIAVSPITQQCLEGKVVFVIPYVELLAYYIDQNNLPQWFNYLPSILILIVVFASLMSEEKEDEEEEGKNAPQTPAAQAWSRDRSYGSKSTAISSDCMSSNEESHAEPEPSDPLRSYEFRASGFIYP